MKLEQFSHRAMFVAWQTEPDEQHGRLVKAPYRVKGPLSRASVKDPSHWGTLEQAVAQARRLSKPHRDEGGYGIILGEYQEDGVDWVLIGIDWDTCRDVVAGTIADFARVPIERLNSYTEISPSGTGLHTLMRVRKEVLARINMPRHVWKKGGGDHPPAIELYTGGRYFTITRNHAGFSEEINEVSEEDLRWLTSVHAVDWLAEGSRNAERARDNSRSGKAFVLAIRLVKAGKVYDDFIPALTSDPDPSLGEWYREKGAKNQDREAKRTWEQAVKRVALDEVKGGKSFHELNSQYAIIHLQDKVMVLHEHRDAFGRTIFSLLSPDSFRLWLADRKVDIGMKEVPLADLWMTWDGRRKFNGMTFSPGGAPEGLFNLWKGFAVEPSPRGSCELFKRHLLDNVCNGDVKRFTWLFAWFADLFQNPEIKPGTSVVLRGNQGVGKTIVGQVFGKLLGPHYVQTGSSRFVSGQFNSHLISALLLHCDEAFWAGDKKAESILKDLVTGSEHFIERKGIDPYPVPNLLRLFITGDQEWLVPAGLRERRFALYDVAENRIQDTGYFREIIKELNDGGYERLLHELLEFDLTEVNLRTIPNGEGLLDQKIASLTPEQSWWLDVLSQGQLPFGCDEPRRCPVSVLFDHYVNHAHRQGARRRSIEVQLGRFLQKVVGEELTRYKGTYRVDGLGSEATGRIFVFPPLQQCRAKFADSMKEAIDWDEDRDWDTLPISSVNF